MMIHVLISLTLFFPVVGLLIWGIRRIEEDVTLRYLIIILCLSWIPYFNMFVFMIIGSLFVLCKCYDGFMWFCRKYNIDLDKKIL